MEERVILVDARDVPIGTAGKLEAHQRGVLHRAFSVFVRDDDGRLLLQRRAESKYHSGGLWSNSCCGHPRPGEATADAASRRLFEELGVRAGALREVGQFTYRADLRDGLVEHECDHVLVGRIADRPRPDPAEVAEWRWITDEALRAELAERPEAFTAWLPMVVAAMEAGGVARSD
jgi:isopentenyl-diphosphate delta-isomerase